MDLLFRVVNHLIKKEQTLSVVSRPPPIAGESDQDFLHRVQMDRVLSLHANYAPNL